MKSSKLRGAGENNAFHIASYILTCYKESRFCDMILISSRNEAIPCHKLVLCSLSETLRRICLAEDDTAGDITNIHLPEFTHREVRDVVDTVYDSMGQHKVEMARNELTTVLGIECRPLKTLIVKPTLLKMTMIKEEARNFNDEEKEQTPVKDEFSDPEMGETSDADLASHLKVEFSENVGEEVFNDKKLRSRNRRKSARMEYKDDTNSESNGDEYIDNSSSHEIKSERPQIRQLARKRRGYPLRHTNKKKKDYIPTETEQDLVKQEDSLVDNDDNGDGHFDQSSSDESICNRLGPLGRRRRPDRKKREHNLRNSIRKSKTEEESDDEYVPSENDQDFVNHEESPADDENCNSEDEEKRAAKSHKQKVRRKYTKRSIEEKQKVRRKYTKRRIEVPTAEELLAQETDPAVIKLQRQLSASDSNWWKPPKPNTTEALQTALRDEMSSGRPARFKVKKAGKFFNIAPVVKRHFQWNGMNSQPGKKPAFAAIVGVSRAISDDLDPRLVKFNGHLLAGCPLAWSFPRSGEELDAQYDAVMTAYGDVLGLSDEELHCNKMFYLSQFGRMEKCNKYVQTQDIPKAYRDPKGQVVAKLSKKFKTIEEAQDKDALRAELDRLEGAGRPADQGKDPKPDLNLQFDRLRLQFDPALKEFEGLIVVAWHTDGQTLGKVVNFDENKAIFMGLLRDVWLNGSIMSTSTLPFSNHIFSRFTAVYERAFAPRLLKRMIDGTCPSRICPKCGKSFNVLTENEKIRFDVHVKNHELDILKCGCAGVDKIKTLTERQRHMKLHHAGGKFVQCTVPKCPDVVLKGSLDDHMKHMHVDMFCEQCGRSFSNKRSYQTHYQNRHTLQTCKVCKVEVFQYHLKSHMRTHRGDPIPCPECGTKFADQRNIKRHMKAMHTPREELPYPCPYPDCERAWEDPNNLLQHLNNMHFKVYVFVCEFGCPLGRYKDQSNLRAHYRKKHGTKIRKAAISLREYLETMNEEERTFHESILNTSEHVGKLYEINSGNHFNSMKYLNSPK